MSEATTIDTLELEIKSNGQKAAEGIQDVAVALEALKGSGKITTAINNLKNLASALDKFTKGNDPSHKITAIKDGLQSLSKVDSVKGVTSSIKSLAKAVESMQDVELGGIDTKFQTIATAAGRLSGVKAGGLGNMVNALAKIAKVNESLDDEAIAKFADRVEKLNKVLTPLSTKMTTIQAGLRGVNSKARTTGSGIKHLGDKVNVTTLNLSSMITVMQGVISALQPVVRLLSDAIAQAIEWDGVAARFGRGFGANAQETYEWIQRLNEEMGINVQQFMQYSSVYATMLTGFGVAMEDAGKMALGYTELTYDIWAGYNDVYKTFEEAAEAVKSAIAGEVEPVRRAGFTIVESTLEMTAANYGLDISLEKATESQKSYLRYLTLVDQAYAQGLVGTYAKELNTAEGLMRTFSQQLKSLAQAFGSLFLPVLVRVMPWVQAFIELLTEAIALTASFFGIEIQPVDWSGYNGNGFEGLGDSAGDAAESITGTGDAIDETTKKLKELKNATIGIDELNVISPPEPTSGSSGGTDPGIGDSGFGGLDIDSLWDESIFDSINSKVDEIKQKLKETVADVLPLAAGLAAAFAGLRLMALLDDSEKVKTAFDVIKKKVEDVFLKYKGFAASLAKGLTIAGISLIVGKLVWDFTGAYLEGGKLSDLLKALGTTVLGTALAYWLTGAVGAGIVLAVSGVVTLTRLAVEISEGNVEWNDTESIITGLVGGLSTALGAALTWKTLSPAIMPVVKKLLVEMALWFTLTFPEGIGAALVSALTTGWTTITGAIAAIPVWGWIAAAVAGLLALAITDYDFTDIGRKVGTGLAKGVKSVIEFVQHIGMGIINGFDAVFTWCEENINWDSVKNFLGILFTPSKWMEYIIEPLVELGVDIVEGLWKGIFAGADNLIENIKEFCDGFIQGWKDVFEIHSPSKKMVSLGEDILAGLLEPLKPSKILEALGKLWETITGWFSGKSNNQTIEAEVKLIKKDWKSVKDWIGAIPVVSQTVSLAKKGWTSISKWIGSTSTISQKIGLAKSGWSTIKKWVGSVPKINQNVGLAKSGWSSVKSWIGSMPKLSAKIGLVKNGWSSIKSWLGNLSYKLDFKLPKIGINWGKKTVLGFTISYPSSFYTYAKGGFPDFGEMFIARENGAEMVGKIGSKTTVANNDQIVEGISEGVYAAVVAAMKASEGGGNQKLEIYLDGRQVHSVVKKRERESGASIVTNGAYAY